MVGNAIQLVNDALAPGNNYVYGTDGAGAKAWRALSAFGVTTLTGTAGQVLVNGGTAAASGAVTLTLATALVSINSVTSVAGQNLTLSGASGQRIVGSTGILVTGAIGSSGTYARPDAGLEIQGNAINGASGTGPILSLYNTVTAAQASGAGGNQTITYVEEAIVFDGLDTSDVSQKTAAISAGWSTTPNGSGYGVLRLQASAAGGATNNVPLHLFGNHSAIAFGSVVETSLGAATFGIKGKLSIGNGTLNAARNLNLVGATDFIVGRTRGSATDYSIDQYVTGATPNWDIGQNASNNFSWYNYGTAAAAFTLTYVDSTATFAGNLTVSGTGASSFGGTLTVSGQNLSVGGAVDASVACYLRSSALTGTNQYGVYNFPVFSSSATSSGRVFVASLATAAASFTMVDGYGVLVSTPTLGAGSAITNTYGVSVGNQGVSGVTNAYGIDIAAQSGASVLNVGLRNAGTTLFTNATEATTISAASAVLSGGLSVTKNLISGQGQGWGVTNVTTAAGTTTLTSASTSVQIFVGSTTQTVQLPAANLFGAGIAVVYVIKSRSSGIVTVQRAGSDTLETGTSYLLNNGDSITLVSNGVSHWAIV